MDTVRKTCLRLLVLITFAVSIDIQDGSAWDKTDFLKYINKTKWDYQNVLVLGVGADLKSKEVQEILQNYHFDKIIPLSEGNKGIDFFKATVAKLGISPTVIGNFDDINGKNIKNLFSHSWGTSESINFISMTGTTKVGTLHCLGSPESAAFNYALINSLQMKKINKVYFHINQGDRIADLKNFPKLTTLGGFNNKIEFLFYLTERQPVDTKKKDPANIPIFNAPLGFKQQFYYNCPEAGHPLEKILNNINFVYNRAPGKSIFAGEQMPPFLVIPAYFVSPSLEYPGKSMNEAKILTEMTHNKHKAIIVGKGPEADLMYQQMVIKLGGKNVKRLDSFSDEKSLQSEARKIGADIILGVKGATGKEALITNASNNKYGGIDNSPNPILAGKGGSEIRQEVIKSQPSKESLSWLSKKSEVRAVSLRILQEKVKGCQGSGTCPEDLLQLAGLKKITGYIIDEKNRDLVLIGKNIGNLPPLYLEDFVIALRNAWLLYFIKKGDTYYYSNPGCSIDPDPQVFQRLQKIKEKGITVSSEEKVRRNIEEWNQTCQSPQKVRVIGIPFDNRFAWVMVTADYDMKKLVDGSEKINVPGFFSLSDLSLGKAKRDIQSGRKISPAVPSMNRFWFSPGENFYKEDKGVILIEKCSVILLTEEEHINRKGEIAGMNQPDPLAYQFCNVFSKKYLEITREKPIYTELENLFQWVALVKIMKFKSALQEAKLDLGYLLNHYQVTETKVSPHLPGRFHVKELYVSGRYHVMSCGGVSINIKVSQKNFIQDSAKKLRMLRTVIIKSRPSSEALFWDVPF